MCLSVQRAPGVGALPRVRGAKLTAVSAPEMPKLYSKAERLWLVGLFFKEPKFKAGGCVAGGAEC